MRKFILFLSLLILVPTLLFAQRSTRRYSAHAYIFNNASKDSLIAIGKYFMLADTVTGKIVYWDPTDSTWSVLLDSLNTVEIFGLLFSDSVGAILGSTIRDTVNAALLSVDSLNLLGATKPFHWVQFGDFVPYPDFDESIQDTLSVAADWDTVNGVLSPIIKAWEADTSVIIQTIDIFKIFEVPFWAIGIDSISFYVKTDGDNSIADSSDISLQILEIDGDGVTTSLDSVLHVESADIYTHYAFTSFSTLTRYEKFIVKIIMRSLMSTQYAYLGNMKIYWKEGS